jgi:hypothetical protein
MRTHVFFPTILFWRKWREALLSFAIRGHVLVHGEVGWGECHGSRVFRASNGGSSLCGGEELSWCFGFRRSGMQVEAI